MKKYPVTYKGKEYEVRWENGSILGARLFDHVTIYEIKKILGFKYYKEVYSMSELCLRECLDVIGIYKEDSSYYINQVKCLFDLMEGSILEKKKEQEEEIAKHKALKEWDGHVD